MSTSRRIRELLNQGYKPSELVKMGFPKSTVYIVYKKWVSEKIEALKSLHRLLDWIRELVICTWTSEDRLLCIYKDKKMGIELQQVDDKIYVAKVSHYEEG